MPSFDTLTDLDDYDDDASPAMNLTEVRNDASDGGDLVGWVGKIPHSRHWAAVIYFADESIPLDSSTRTVSLGDGNRYTADMVEDYVSGLSMSSAETGYAAGTVLFCSPGDATLFLLAADEQHRHCL